MAFAQESGYLTNRIKPGDICYLDGHGQECFMDYRDWDSERPAGAVVGVVYYSYYGTEPYGDAGDDPRWHGWMVAVDEADSLCWAPQNSVCYDTCVAMYPVDGVDTPWNPHHNSKSYAFRDTCGWQNTYRLLEFIYSHQAILSEETSPAFHYIFTEKNGVTDFSEKPAMTRNTWYLPAYGQLRYLYGAVPFVNAAIAACGGTLFNTGCWLSSTEVGENCLQAMWNLFHYGNSSGANGWLKHHRRSIRAIRNF